MAASDPAKNDEVWKSTCDKELMQWQSPTVLLKTLQMPAGTVSESSSFYRVPVPGDMVTVSGMRRRPELNGAKGEILSSQPDEFGRVTVRVWDDAVGDSRKMKVQPFRLVPNSSPAFDLIEDDRSSVRSLSRQGSVVSASSRALGSAISFSAKSALSNTGSGAHRMRAGTPMVK
eukprot:CAMPEP_0197651596 /NCGR_PEP_ID=MMETSP1338-20131121/33209_1 /TAXON_ID=43686 ORGANISM="Pelagodinium beii, Strain RCC1491" /NCGR_SAMPLE_ID=MMETSP1338 /ASSEMBLY_ACC=CAM_ASM_000754 /LENGTH=173 /DNA_ID=CAMNT_0043226275 /DNA_START=44 /DNA_END=565 /DNA_ORIENTATION=-